MTTEALLTLKEVSKKYGNGDVLTDVSLTINKGDCLLLRRNNGSGKSTMLRIVSGLIPINSGERLLRHSDLVIGYTPDRFSKLRMTSTEYLTHMGSGKERNEWRGRNEVVWFKPWQGHPKRND